MCVSTRTSPLPGLPSAPTRRPPLPQHPCSPTLVTTAPPQNSNSLTPIHGPLVPHRPRPHSCSTFSPLDPCRFPAETWFISQSGQGAREQGNIGTSRKRFLSPANIFPKAMDVPLFLPLSRPAPPRSRGPISQIGDGVMNPRGRAPRASRPVKFYNSESYLICIHRYRFALHSYWMRLNCAS